MLYTPAYFALFLANLCVVASFTCYFLFPLFVTTHNGTVMDIGLLMGGFALASAACRPWIGPMIDRIGRKKSYTCGSLLMVALPLAYPFFDFTPLAVLPLLALRILHGVGLAICFTSAFTFIVDLIPPQRLNEGIGLFGISGLLGIAIGPSVGELALKLSGFTGLFLISSSLAGVALLAHLPLKERAVHVEQVNASPSFFSLLRQPRHHTVALLAFLFGFGVSTSGNFIAPLCEQRTLHAVTPFFVCYSLAAVLTRLFIGRLADRVGERRVLPWAFLVCALGLLLVFPAFNTPVLMLSGFVCGAGHGLLFPTLNTLAIRDIPHAYRGSVTGIFTGAIDSGIFVGSLVLGAIAELLPLPALFLISAVIMLAGLRICFVPLRKKGPDSPAP